MKPHSIGLALAIAGIIAFNPLNLRADITTGLVGWWTFDETSGETAVDSAGALNLNGTLQPTGTGPRIGQLGRVGLAYSLDGVDDDVRFFASAAAGLVPATGDFSAFLWFNMPSLIPTVSAQGMLFSCNNGQVNRANNGIQNVGGTNRVYWFHNGGPAAAVYYGPPVTNNVWYLLGVTRSNNVFIGWLNTNSYALGTYTAPISTAADWVLGRQISGTSYFPGRVDDLRVYNRAMTPADVLELYSQPSGLGQPQSISLELVRTQMVTGTFQQAHAFAAFAPSASVEVTSEAGITYSSSDTNVVSVSATGLLTALNLGTATVSATFSNQTGSALVMVVPPDITNGLVGWWTFDETFGETAVDSAGVLNLNGTLQPTGNGPRIGQLGRVGPAYYLDGVDDDVKFFTSAAAGLVPATADFSFFLWVRLPTLVPAGGNQLLFSCNNGQVNRACNAIQNVGGTNRVYWFHNGGPGAAYYGPALTTNVWYLFGVSRSDNVFTGWFNTNAYALGTFTAPISTTTDWLVGCQSTANFFKGFIDDLRVYNRPLSAAEVQKLYTQPAGLGALQSVSLALVRTQMVAGTFQQAHAFADFSQFPGIEVTTADGVAYSSSDTNVVGVSASGLLAALKPGTAMLSVTYSNQTGSAFVTVVPLVTQLIHRYSFTADTRDAVGTNDGTLYGNAAVAGGALALSSATMDYVDLGPNAITGADQLTFEAWASFGTNGVFCRLFDFGNNDAVNGISFVYVSPHNSSNGQRISLNGETASVRNALQDYVDVPGTLDSLTNVHVVTVYRPLAGYVQLFVNGSLVGQNTNVTTDLASVVNNYSYLGKSQFAANPGINMLLDEFRVYNGALDPTNVAINAAAGPNNLVTSPGPLASVSLAVASPLPEWVSAPADVRGNFANVSGVNLALFPGVSFTSSDTNVATVSGTGLVTGVAAGSATITASYSGQSASQAVIVSPVPTTRVLVSCITNKIVLAYDSKGTNWRAAGTFATGTYAGKPLTLPQAIAQDSSGAVYLGEQMYGGRILKFTTAGTFLGVVATNGIDFSGPPEFLTLGPDANLYMSIGFTTNAADMIDKITLPAGPVSTNIPTTDTLNYTFSTPRGLAFGPDGFLYVANRGANKILKFNPTSGVYIADFVSITTPNAFIWDNANSRFLVSSLGAPAIQAIDTNGVASVVLNDGVTHSIIGMLTQGTNVFFTDFNLGYIAQVTGTNTTRSLFTGLDHPTVMLPLTIPGGVRLTVQYVGGNVVLSWLGSGSLQQADAVAGPYSDISAAASPYSVPPAATKKFFRVRIQ